jgi:hypothetical protein
MGNVRKNKKANIEHQMDRMVRLQALEGAAGVPMNTWVSRGSPVDVARGMALAAAALPGGVDESWFAEGPQGLYRAAVAASSDDIVQEMIMGMSMKTGKPVKSLFYEIGKNKAAGIGSGSYDVKQARNLASLLAKRRMMSESIQSVNQSKSLSRNLGVSGNPPSTRDDMELEESGSSHLFSATPEDRGESLLSMLSDRRDPRGRKVMETLEDNIERLMGGNAQRATVVMTEPSRGARVSNLSPSAAGTNLPSINRSFLGFKLLAFSTQLVAICVLLS